MSEAIEKLVGELTNTLQTTVSTLNTLTEKVSYLTTRVDECFKKLEVLSVKVNENSSNIDELDTKFEKNTKNLEVIKDGYEFDNVHPKVSCSSSPMIDPSYYERSNYEGYTFQIQPPQYDYQYPNYPPEAMIKDQGYVYGTGQYGGEDYMNYSVNRTYLPQRQNYYIPRRKYQNIRKNGGYRTNKRRNGSCGGYGQKAKYNQKQRRLPILHECTPSMKLNQNSKFPAETSHQYFHEVPIPKED